MNTKPLSDTPLNDDDIQKQLQYYSNGQQDIYWISADMIEDLKRGGLK